MFVVSNKNKSYRVWFKNSVSKDTNKSVTECHIQEWHESKDNRKEVSVGMASCHISDKENKILGRKYAFTKAISTFPKEDRTTFWNTYKEEVRYITK